MGKSLRREKLAGTGGRPAGLGAWRQAWEASAGGAIAQAGAVHAIKSNVAANRPTAATGRVGDHCDQRINVATRPPLACPRQVVSGNYVTAKRRGIVNGIDFGAFQPGGSAIS